MQHVKQKRDSEFLLKRHFLTSGTFNISEKNHDAQSLSVWLHLLLRRDQNHHFNLTSKVMTASEQIFKKTAGRIRKNSKNRIITSTLVNHVLIETITSLYHSISNKKTEERK